MIFPKFTNHPPPAHPIKGGGIQSTTRIITLIITLYISFLSLPATAAENLIITEYPGAGEIILTAAFTLGARAIDFWGHSSNVTPREPAGTLDYRINNYYGDTDHAIEVSADIFYWSNIAVPVTYYGMHFFLGPDTMRPLHARMLLTWWQGYTAVYFSTQVVKVTVRRPRPNGEDTGSFFSGHASISFYSAAFFSAYIGEEISSRISSPAAAIFLSYVLTPALLYSIAGFTAWSRIRNHNHYFSDVVTGGITGTLIGTITYYFFFPRKTKKGRKYSFFPIVSPQRNGFAFQMTF